MRNPNNRRNTAITASMRARSHSFSGIAPPAYEEEEPLTRATSSLAIPLPSYEEATSAISFNISSSTINLELSASVRDLESGGGEANDDEEEEVPIQPEQNQQRDSRSSTTSSVLARALKRKRLFKIIFLISLCLVYSIAAYFLYDLIVNWVDPKDKEGRYGIIVMLALPAFCLVCAYRLEIHAC